MLSEVQKTEIMKATSGGISKGSSMLASTNLVDESPAMRPTLGTYSPTKMLPFDQFYSILKTVPNVEDKDLTVLRSPRSPRSKSRKHGKLALDDRDQPVSPRRPVDHGRSPTKSVDQSTSAVLSVEPINVVQQLMDRDKHFEAFLKINENERPSSKLMAKLNGTVSKPRRQRKLPQLGKEAVLLSDSRGNPSKLAAKGFKNVFQPPKLEDCEEGSPTGLRVDTSVKVVDRDLSEPLDVIDRLVRGRNPPVNTRPANSMGPDQSTFESEAVNDVPRYPHYVSKARTIGIDHKTIRVEALQYIQQRLPHCVDKSTFVLDEQMEIDMQHKLMAAWETLSAPMNDRLTFMDKYSSFAYASEMSRAVDIWSEIAVYSLMFSEAMEIQKKFQVS
jgi:hypothetical protein